MKIGELAKLSDVPASTIRFYEQKGLLPATARTPGGYRQYDQDAFNRLLLIKFSQSLGFALDELPKLVNKQGNWDHDLVMQKLLKKKQEVTVLVEEMQRKQLRIDNLIARLEQTWECGECMQQDKLASIIGDANL